MRLVPIHPLTAIKIDSTYHLGLNNKVMISKKSKKGIDDMVLMNHMIRSSTQPPKKPASAPISTPIVMVNSAPLKPIVNEMRPPCKSRANWSRPNSSVPNQFSALGGP